MYVPAISNLSVYAEISTKEGIFIFERFIPRFSFIEGNAMPNAIVWFPLSTAFPPDTFTSLKCALSKIKPLAIV